MTQTGAFPQQPFVSRVPGGSHRPKRYGRKPTEDEAVQAAADGRRFSARIGESGRAARDRARVAVARAYGEPAQPYPLAAPSPQETPDRDSTERIDRPRLSRASAPSFKTEPPVAASVRCALIASSVWFVLSALRAGVEAHLVLPSWFLLHPFAGVISWVGWMPEWLWVVGLLPGMLYLFERILGRMDRGH